MEQVHKETLEQVENALPGRESIDLEIFGTEGIPESEVAAHNQRIMAEYAQKEADRRAASGHSNAPKKPKIDISKELDPEEIKKKLEAHKKAMASGGVTQVAPNASVSLGRSQFK
jgi:anthranilate/para-aminobenzoate synthase component I